MVKMYPDPTGRFPERPFYEPDELDRECERIISNFLVKRRGAVVFPVLTEDLHVLIEADGADCDSSVDLRRYGDDVEGLTYFPRDQCPQVKISDRLATDPRRVNRLRTTLAHEFGHLRFHRFLFEQRHDIEDLFARKQPDDMQICKRDSILNAPRSDWMEWQAGYISGAILMPATPIRAFFQKYCESRGVYGALPLASRDSQALIGRVKVDFQVSEEAARVRLQALNLLSDGAGHPSLFA